MNNLFHAADNEARNVLAAGSEFILQNLPDVELYGLASLHNKLQNYDFLAENNSTGSKKYLKNQIEYHENPTHKAVARPGVVICSKSVISRADKVSGPHSESRRDFF